MLSAAGDVIHCVMCIEQAVDELEAENKRLAEQHSEELKILEQTAEDKQKQLIETHRLTVQDLTNRHEQDLLTAQQHAEDTQANLQQVASLISMCKTTCCCLFLSIITHCESKTREYLTKIWLEVLHPFLTHTVDVV